MYSFFFFFSSQNNSRRRRIGKKVRLRVYKLCIIFSYKKNRDIFISLCGQESSIIEQCLATKCKVHRNPLSFFLSTCFTIAWSTPMITILATVTGKMKNNNTKQKRKYQSRTADLQLYSTKF